MQEEMLELLEKLEDYYEDGVMCDQVWCYFASR